MKEQKVKYLTQILALFMKYGIKSVTMDDMAKELGVSKKTLYKYFKDKNEIVSTLMKMDINEEMKILDSLTHSSENAIEETYAFSQVLIEKLKSINPSLLYDLEKYHPKAWNLFVAHKRVDVFGCIKVNIDRGKEEGYYLDYLDAEVVAKLYSEKIDMIFNLEIFPLEKFSIEDVYTKMIDYHLRGIINEKGRNYLIQTKKNKPTT